MIIFGQNEKCRQLKAIASKNITLKELVPDALGVAEKYHISGNLIANYIAYLLISDENTFSLAYERSKSSGKPSIDKFAVSDFEEIYAILSSVPNENYTPVGSFSGKEDRDAGKLIASLAKKILSCSDGKEIMDEMKKFYKNCGAGSFALYKAFSVSAKGNLVPVLNFSDASFDKIFGYERQKNLLRANTEAFLSGKNSNNVLLYGDSGTGKSTAVKALVNTYSDSGLRIIGVQKHQYEYLPGIIEELNLRNYKFIIYLDDLSFENFEIEYKYLKAVIEGGVQERPENILIMATSNRRHLVKESFDEREGGGDIHREETMNEKISLSERFGLQIYYAKPDQQVFFDMVCFMAKTEHPEIPEDELISGARKWAVSRGGFSGRAARQYILSLSSDKSEK